MIEVIRYYMGKIRGLILMTSGRKALFSYLEEGVVGSKELGYKHVKTGNSDIIPIRMLWKKRREND